MSFSPSLSILILERKSSELLSLPPRADIWHIADWHWGGGDENTFCLSHAFRCTPSTTPKVVYTISTSGFRAHEQGVGYSTRVLPCTICRWCRHTLCSLTFTWLRFRIYNPFEGAVLSTLFSKELICSKFCHKLFFFFGSFSMPPFLCLQNGGRVFHTNLLRVRLSSSPFV